MDTTSSPAGDAAGTDTVDVVVVGGGLAGLTAATFAARDGATVQLLDARAGLGGRARTAVHDGFELNEGPHALYRATDGMRVLRELGIRPDGGNPPLTRSRLALDGGLHRSPPARAAAQVASLVGHAAKDRRDPGLVGVSAREWIDGRVTDPAARHVAGALVRVSTYSGDLATLSADAAAAQLHAAVRGVVYLHHGWAQLVGALGAAARAAGVSIRPGCKAGAISADGDRWVVDAGADGMVAARSIVIATGGPGLAQHLLTDASPGLAAAAARALPVHAACLDLGLRRLTRPSVRFILGADRPTYASIHTPGANLAPEGRHVVHLMHYEPDDTVGTADLEALADELQPGWRDEEMVRQVGHRRVVAFDRPQPGSGMSGRPGIGATGLPGILVAGDWVGPDDLLGGAALSSGRAAGRAAARRSTNDGDGRRVPAASAR